MSNFDYGPIKADGQHTNYPSSVLLTPEGKPDFKQPIRNKYLHLKCGVVTMMRGDNLCFTYATNPGFYGRTFCVGCHSHHPLNEFVWDVDNTPMDEIHGKPGEDLRR